MLKRLFLLWIFSGSLDGFSQVSITTLPGDGSVIMNRPCSHNLPNCKCMKIDVITPDTLHAELLITTTTRRWGVAHARDGYVVRKGNEVTYLDNNHKPFPMCVTVWGWVKWEERKRRRR